MYRYTTRKHSVIENNRGGGLREWHARPTHILLCVFSARSLATLTQRSKRKDVISIPKSRWYMIRFSHHSRRISSTLKSALGSNTTTHELDRDRKKIQWRSINFRSHASNKRNSRAEQTSVRMRRINFRPRLSLPVNVNLFCRPRPHFNKTTVHRRRHPNPASN